MEIKKKSLFWFRRDLRLTDNRGLFEALKNSMSVFSIFIFDNIILDKLKEKKDRRVEFLLESVKALEKEIKSFGGDLIIKYGDPKKIIPELCHEFRFSAVFVNNDYESYATSRDSFIEKELSKHKINFYRFKDQVIFEKNEIMTKQFKPYTVFTPYKKAWLSTFNPELDCKNYSSKYLKEKMSKSLISSEVKKLEDIGFLETNLKKLKILPGACGAKKTLENLLKKIDFYDQTRDFPFLNGTSYLSIHNRFGTISIRELIRSCINGESKGANIWLSELIWRDFYFNILANFPHVEKKSFNPKYQNLKFTNSKKFYRKWCEGDTGYPIIDAGMKQLNSSGYMHNRLRMITASFLVKDLHIDWRLGERYFSKMLNDFDLSANNGGWQWASSTGCDSQPYFRIFNPVLQSKKFDKDSKFIRFYIPELRNVPEKFVHTPWEMPLDVQKESQCIIGKDYPERIVMHDDVRKLTLKLYKSVDT